MSRVDSGQELTREDVREILDIVDRSHFGEVRIELDDIQVYVRKTGEQAVVQPEGGTSHVPASHVPAVSGPGTSATTEPATGRRGDAASPHAGDASGHHLVKAPMVGTFYRRPAPGEPSFVEVGDQVGTDDVLCLIEVMKLFNSVTAEVAGRVVDILVADGATVEYGQPIVAIEPADGQ